MNVSVIVTCFNLERFIGEAIASVLDQDFPDPVEIVVVDDCSTDASPGIIQAVPAVRYVRTERNCGVLLATVKGLEEATGELIFFLDGDDLWEKDKLSLCVAAFEQDADCALVTHDLAYADAEGRVLDRATRPGQVLGPLDDDARSEAIIRGLQRQEDYIWLGSAWAVRRTLGRVDEFVAWARNLPDPENTYQDWPLAMWVASLPAVRAAYVPGKLFRYRLHQANYSGDARSAGRAIRNFIRARNTLSAMRQLAIERGLPEAIPVMLEQRACAYDYLACLYRGERLRALSMFPEAWADFRVRGQAGKEVVRLGAILLIGPDRFARLFGGRQA